MLRAGDLAPAIELPDTDMQPRSLSEFAGRYVVLYFYPRDDTPGCTVQATEFSELIDEFEAADIQIVGISTDDCFSHQAFREKYGLRVLLLADAEQQVCNRYGVIQEKEKQGVKKLGVVRSSFVVDPDGKLVYVEYGVTPAHHAGKMLAFVKAQQDK